MKVKKIHVNKSDEPASIAEKIIDTKAKDIILSIPKFSKFAESLSNFHLIKREGEALDKNIKIESVDDKVIELSSISGLEAVNPFFVKSGKHISDIVPHRKSSSRKAPKERLVPKLHDEETEKRFFNRRKVLITVGIPVAIVVVWFAITALPRAEITILTKKLDWSYDGPIVVDKELASSDFKSLAIPGQLFTATRNLSSAFPATGRKVVERKAKGTITVYNAHSSQSQPLVVRTRFETPDGKVYRLTKGITVPGAKIIDGKIEPSSIDAEVVADQPGEEYNIGPIHRYSIPGFKGSPKFKTFYGQSLGSMSGGFIGEAAYPLDSDIAKAEEDALQQLEDALQTTLIMQIPDGFKILDGARDFSIVNKQINTETDAADNFEIFLEGELKIIAFKETELKETLLNRAQDEEGSDLMEVEATLEYAGKVATDFVEGTLKVSVKYEAVLGPDIDLVGLKDMVKGKTEEELRGIIFTLPDVSSAKISLWPFWVKTVPDSDKAVEVLLD